MVVPWEVNLSAEEEASYMAKVGNFILSPTTTREAIQYGARFHHAVPEINHSTQLASDLWPDLDERLECARKIQESCVTERPRVEFNLFSLAAVLVGDLPAIRRSVDKDDRLHFETQGQNIEPLLANC